MNMKPIISSNIPKPLFILGLIGFGIIAFTLSAYFLNFHGELLDGHDKWGTFGDFIGGTTSPLLGFLTFIGVLWTIYLNKLEIEENRKEAEEKDVNKKQQEIYRIIETIYQSIAQSLQNISLTMPDLDYIKPVKLHNIITHNNNVIDFEKIKLLNGPDYNRNVEMLKDPINLVRALHKYCKLYEDFGGSPDITYFFKLYFLGLVKFLAGIGKISRDIDLYFSEAVGTRFHTYGAVMMTVEPTNTETDS
jgi:hypothetical protein